MDYWYENGWSITQKAASKKIFGALFTTSNVIHSLGHDYHNRVKKWCKEKNCVPHWLENNQWIMWVTSANVLSEQYLSNVNYSMRLKPDYIAEVITATSYIPFLLSKWFYTKINDNKCIDGVVVS